MSISPQLSLNLELQDTATWQYFYAGHNQQALASVQQLALGMGEHFIYLAGPSGVGKTHLLQAACQQVREQHQSAIYVSFARIQEYDEALLDNLEALSLVCLDDIDEIAGLPNWEEKVFCLFNAIWAHGGRLLVAARNAPNELGFGLADLVSRLNWGLRFRLQALSEAEILAALKWHAEQRGLVLPDEVASFLLRRVQRDMAALVPLFKELDQASWVTQRKLTVPFVKQVLGL